MIALYAFLPFVNMKYGFKCERYGERVTPTNNVLSVYQFKLKGYG